MSMKKYYQVGEVFKDEETVPVERRILAIRVCDVTSEGVSFQITNQSHRCSEFTPKGDCFKATNGLKVKSVANPGFRDARALVSSYVLFVQGCNHPYDAKTLTVPRADFAAITQAVQEYNDTNGVDRA